MEAEVLLEGQPATVRVEVLRNTRGSHFMTRAYRLEEVGGRSVWAEYVLPVAHHPTADQALDVALVALDARSEERLTAPEDQTSIDLLEEGIRMHDEGAGHGEPEGLGPGPGGGPPAGGPTHGR